MQVGQEWQKCRELETDRFNEVLNFIQDHHHINNYEQEGDSDLVNIESDLYKSWTVALADKQAWLIYYKKALGMTDEEIARTTLDTGTLGEGTLRDMLSELRDYHNKKTL